MELLQVIKCSLILTAIHVSVWDGMIFEKIRLNYLERLPELIRKPLYECTICMASIWGSIFYFTRPDFAFDFQVWLEFILQVAGFNTLIVGIIYLTFIKNTDDVEGRANG